MMLEFVLLVLLFALLSFIALVVHDLDIETVDGYTFKVGEEEEKEEEKEEGKED